jgi:hypothetical protein
MRLLLATVGFAVLFSLYDVSILWHGGDTLANYALLRDGRDDEVLMYLPAMRNVADGGAAAGECYLADHRGEPSIRPPLPALAGGWLLRATGSESATILLLHVVPPVIGAILLLLAWDPHLPTPWLVLAGILSVCSAAYAAGRRVLDLFVSTDDAQRAYEFWRVSLGYHNSYYRHFHLEFTRFLSPGMTFLFVAASLWLVRDSSRWLKPKTAWMFGALTAFQLYVYPHNAFFMGVLWTVGVIAVALENPKPALWQAMRFAAAAALTAVPFAVRVMQFKTLPLATEIVQRAGYVDAPFKALRWPLLLWLAAAALVVLMVRIKADRVWYVTAASCFLALLGSAAAAPMGALPQSWLMGTRIVVFIVPFIVLIPFVIGWGATQNGLVAGWILVALCGQSLAISEWRAGEFVAGRMRLSDDDKAFLAVVESDTKPFDVVLTDDLRHACLMVSRTNRRSYVAYGICSNASNKELLERLMIPGVICGRTFDEFLAEDYLKGRGTFNGPNGRHWVLHHQNDIKPLDDSFVRATYDELVSLSPKELLSRYRFDYAAFGLDEINERYRGHFTVVATTSPLAPFVQPAAP